MKNFLTFRELNEAKYRLADNAFDKERSLYHKDIKIDDDIRAVISAEVRSSTENNWTATIYLYARPDTGQEKSKIPEQRVPILLRSFESEDEAIKFLKEKNISV